jgi:hypothetical protein
MQPKITDYKIIAFDTLSDLTKEVRLAIIEGWQPYGRCSSNDMWRYMQTLVKYN